ncbi:hypothetical protein EVAR_71592_1 [Eumeta japonica]|uniref:Uncharacterized protein n=1 Tax=Eumeta variegata TaxID=151549 RepID=A0A4C1SSJ3_EUMVA|nr:hypothetical protein EVAR_71592_1 [Eumeta japonica]
MAEKIEQHQQMNNNNQNDGRKIRKSPIFNLSRLLYRPALRGREVLFALQITCTLGLELRLVPTMRSLQ